MEHKLLTNGAVPPVQHLPTLLDITKLNVAVLLTVLTETSDVAKEKQEQIKAIERDAAMSQQHKRDLVHALMTSDLRTIVDLCNSNDNFGEYMHGAAHQMIDQCNAMDKRGEGACKTVVFSFAQMVCLGWRLAEAHLQNISLEQSVQ